LVLSERSPPSRTKLPRSACPTCAERRGNHRVRFQHDGLQSTACAFNTTAFNPPRALSICSVSKSRVLAILAAGNGNASGHHAESNGGRGKRRFVARRRGTSQTASIRAAIAITAAQRAGAFATRGNVDFEALRNEGIDALLRVSCIDILIIAENCAARGFALHAASAFEFRVTRNVAIHVDRRRTRARTTRVAMLRATRRLNFALAATIAGAAGFRVLDAIAIGMRRLTILDERLFAFFVTTSDTIEFGRVTLRDAAHATVVRASGIGSESAAARATSLELERCAFGIAATRNDDATICDAAVLGNELAALGGHLDRQSR